MIALIDVKPYELTDDDKRLILAMSKPGCNIAALHFDGDWLVKMVKIQRERDKLGAGRFPIVRG